MWETSADLFRLCMYKDLSQEEISKFHEMSRNETQKAGLEETRMLVSAGAAPVCAGFLSLSGLVLWYPVHSISDGLTGPEVFTLPALTEITEPIC